MNGGQPAKDGLNLCVRWTLIKGNSTMGNKQHQRIKEYNATPKRIGKLSQHITQYLRQRDPIRYMHMRPNDIVLALNSFIDAKVLRED
jgi:hypothetical protein